MSAAGDPAGAGGTAGAGGAAEIRAARQNSGAPPRTVSRSANSGTTRSRTTAGVVLADVVDRVIDVPEVAALVETAADGAVVTFAGVVRDHDGGRGVTTLDYERHPSASEVIAGVAESVAAEHPGVRIAVLHRVGSLGVGDVALAAAVASAHRAEAFAACGALVDRIKDEVPIWKHQRFTDGTDEWVASL